MINGAGSIICKACKGVEIDKDSELCGSCEEMVSLVTKLAKEKGYVTWLSARLELKVGYAAEARTLDYMVKTKILSNEDKSKRFYIQI